jgi:hypothetical protein
MSVAYHARMARLEAQQRRQHPDTLTHFLSVVRVPWGEPDQARWLRELPCACGQVGCENRGIGLLVPDTAPSGDVWAAAVQRYQEARR